MQEKDGEGQWVRRKRCVEGKCMVVKGRGGLLLCESKGPGQARPTSQATASRLLRALVSQIVCCGKSFASMTHHHGTQPQTHGKTREIPPEKQKLR